MLSYLRDVDSEGRLMKSLRRTVHRAIVLECWESDESVGEWKWIYAANNR